MRNSNQRPLTRHEILIRLLFEHADEIISKLEFLNESADRLLRLDVMINGFDGTPGLIEVVEALTFEVNRVERRCGRAPSLDNSGIRHILAKVELMLDEVISAQSISQTNKGLYQGAGWKFEVSMWVVSLMGLLNLSLFAWSVIL
jgi:hypothetical protein